VYRLAAGREYLVRGAVKAPVAGALSRIDFEVPFGVEVTYRAEMFDSAGDVARVHRPGHGHDCACCGDVGP
jgi:hypothetical protein